MEETIKSIIEKAKKKIQHLDTEKILCYTIDSAGKIMSCRTVSNKSYENCAYMYYPNISNMMNNKKTSYLVLLHNHPDSSMSSSNNDDKLTDFIRKMCAIRNIILYDHIILMKDSEKVFSYRENNKRRFLTRCKNG